MNGFNSVSLVETSYLTFLEKSPSVCCSDGSDEIIYDQASHGMMKGRRCGRLVNHRPRWCYIPERHVCNHEVDCYFGKWCAALAFATTEELEYWGQILRRWFLFISADAFDWFAINYLLWSYLSKPGVGNLYILSRAAWIVHYRWRAAKEMDFILTFYLYVTMGVSGFSWLIV